MSELILKQITAVVLMLTISVNSPTVFATSDEIYSNNDQDDYSGEYYKSGYNDGQNGPFSQGTYNHCGEGNGDEDYYNGFVDGCMSVEGNTRDVCESATDA
jgi:hypothetical protein